MTEQVSEPTAEAQSSEENAQWGLRLAHERRERELEVTQVAAELRLDVKLLESIERQDAAALPVPSFVKGYLRSYARFLDIDAEPIIAAYDKVASNDAPSIAPTRNARPIQAATSKDSGPRTVTTLLIAVLVISFLVWWGGTLLSTGDISESNSAQDTMELVLEPEVAPLEEATMPTPAESVGESVMTGDVAEAPVADVASSIAADIEPVDSLILEFNADSWVEITDANDQRVFFDLGKAGQRYQREGQPPFSILLGNAPAVTLYHNGVVIDHGVHNRKGVAKFKLGE